MSTLTGRTVATTYKDLLQISNQNSGIDGQYRYIEDGEGTISVLGLSTDGIQINGHVQPATTETHDLGSVTNKFRDLYLSGSTIYLGDKTLTSDDVQAVKDVQTTSLPVSSIAELASTSVQPGDAISFSTLINRPTTLAGYGITDAALANDLQDINDVLSTTIEPLYTEVNAASANWNNTHTSVESTSGDWNDTYTTVANNSGDWFSPGLTTLLNQNSGTWNSATQPDTDVQFNDLTVTGHIAGPAEMRIDPAAVGDNTGRVVIAGDLQVDGVTTTVNSTTMTVSGKTITLAEGATDPSMVDQSGIHVDHVDANILYDSTTDTWRTNRDLVVQDKLTAATLSATGHIMVDGTVDAAGDLKVQGDSVVTQHDVGTAPNQIPQNKDLGSLAYQDAAQIEDLNVDTLELREIAVEKQSDARAVFVYDTRRDSDGGEWRKRTTHTSWYNEPLNTEIRGSRREFPSVAVIVAETGRVTIYDADDPDLPMWMMFGGDNAQGADMIRTINHTTDLKMLNGTLFTTADGGSNLAFTAVSFIEDRADYAREIETNERYKGNIAQRNDALNSDSEGYVGPKPHNGKYPAIGYHILLCCDVCALPGAPIDPGTGLPIPTIAIGHKNPDNANIGTIITNDYTAISVNGRHGNVYHQFEHVRFDNKGDIWWVRNFASGNYGTLIKTTSDGSLIKQYGSGFYLQSPSNVQLIDGDYNSPSNQAVATITTIADNATAVGQTVGLNIFNDDHTAVAHVTNTYNTGYMYGDTFLSLLTDTVAETIGVDEYSNRVTNSSFADSLEHWDDISIGTGTAVYSVVNGNGYAQLNRVDASSTGRIGQGMGLVADVNYKLVFSLVNNSSSGVQVKFYNSQDQSLGPTIILSTPPGADGTYFFVFTGVDGYDGIMFLPINGAQANLDGVTLYQTTELVVNGTFNNYDYGWKAVSQATLDTSGSNAKITADGAVDGYLCNDHTIRTTPGKMYKIMWNFIKGTNTGFTTRFGHSGDQSQEYKVNVANEYTEDGEYEFMFKAEAEQLNMSFIVNQQDTYGFIDNITMREVDANRSAYGYDNDNQRAEIRGLIHKTPVAPGAELVSYSNFSGSNYIRERYSDNLNFSTGDFSISFWMTSPANVTGDTLIFGIGDYMHSDRPRVTCLHHNSGGNDNTLIVTVGLNSMSQIFTLEGLGWLKFDLVRRDGDLFLYKNGKLEQTILDTTDDLNFEPEPSIYRDLFIGAGVSNGVVYHYGHAGELALFRVSHTGPTEQQVKQSYEHEKSMFNAGSHVAIAGDNNYINAAGYDIKTDKLHVGTSHGRSTFNRLCRIDSTDQPVTTAISSYDELIVEQ